MKLINPKVELLPEDGNIFQAIERAGRTCYKSENKITDYSAMEFVGRMQESKHLSMLEHGTVYLTVKIPKNKDGEFDWTTKEYSFVMDLLHNPYTETNIDKKTGTVYITTNYRVIVDHSMLHEYMKYKSERTTSHPRRVSFRITTNRQISHELVRHRKFSFAQESTRYCDYTKDKFGGLTFIIPAFLKDKIKENKENGFKIVDKEDTVTNDFIDCLWKIENTYYNMKKMDAKPQNRALLLPNDIKTEIIMTGFLDDWKYFLDLRYFEKTGKVHPDMKVISTMIYDELWKHGYGVMSLNTIKHHSIQDLLK